MKVGTLETIPEREKPERRKASRSGGSSGKSGGGNGKNPGGGGDGPKDDNSIDSSSFLPDKSRILTGFLLLIVMMTFGGLIAAYVVTATNGVAEWQPFALPLQVWISTAIIIVSSVTYFFAQRAIFENNQPTAKRWMIVTTVLGAAFISSQLLAWLALSGRGFYMASNPYAGFFYIMTAVHAVHVLGGICALGAILLRVWQPAGGPQAVGQRVTLSQVVGWYWHFMGGLWLVLFILLGFWK